MHGPERHREATYQTAKTSVQLWKYEKENKKMCDVERMQENYEEYEVLTSMSRSVGVGRARCACILVEQKTVQNIKKPLDIPSFPLG